MTTTKTREGDPAIKCPMLTSTNYTVWAIRMKNVLKVHKVWNIVETASGEEDKNDLAIGLLFQAIPETLVLQVGELDTAKKVWDAIRARHVGAERVKEARLQTLMSEFDRLSMKEGEKIDDLAEKLSELSSKSSALGEEIEESKLVKKFLKSLPRKKYIHIVASLEQVLDLKDTSFEDIVGRLKAYEERVTEEEETQEDQGKLMYTNTDSQTSRENYDDYRGTEDEEEELTEDGVVEGMELQEAQEQDKDDTQHADELMMHEVVYLNEDKVVPSKFETHDDQENMWIDIKGKGSIEFVDMNGEHRVMYDVYYIPDLKSNIISLGQATEAGCDIRLRGDCLIMHDKDGKLLCNATRSPNRLYKVRMGVKGNACLLSTVSSESLRWHSRLGHINLETIKSMVQRELVVGIPQVVDVREFAAHVFSESRQGRCSHKQPHIELAKHLN
ncbi:uncharacterized protein LOC106412469 [Brassica napus]|uniref:uncharacterized protein LOC106412469 n=1 Tax=Brassica napus TaxID=3708 RepID=UPI0020790B15|nr:uncharacterized protein LOC106412469 [Brassica napus]